MRCQSDRAVEHLLGVRVAGDDLEIGQHPSQLSASSPGQRDAIQPTRDAGLDERQRTEFACRQLIQPVLGQAVLRRRTLKCNTACQGPARPVAQHRRIRNVDVVQRRVQAEGRAVAGHQPHALATLVTQRDRRHGATALERHRVGIRELGHRRTQNVPMLENIQYQNQMIRLVPPHAAT